MKRYRFPGGINIDGYSGEWVKADDYAALEAERDALRATIKAVEVYADHVAQFEDIDGLGVSDCLHDILDEYQPTAQGGEGGEE